MSQELAKKDTSLKAILTGEKMKAQFALALPKHLSPDRFIRVCLTALTRTPKLAECTQESLFKCLLDLSAMGLEPNGREAHLIPYGRECTLIVDYKGLVKLVRQDPSVVDVQCYTIREHDKCTWKNGTIEHSFSPGIDRGEVVSTYTSIQWANGHRSVGEPFTKQEAEAIKKRSKSGSSGPWVSDFVEMWKKSNVRRDSKMWPLKPEILDQINRDDDQLVAASVRASAEQPEFTKPQAQPEQAPAVDVESTRTDAPAETGTPGAPGYDPEVGF